MIKKRIGGATSLSVNDSTIGETIEEKMERVMNNGEPIDATAPIIWTERKEGVLPEYNIRTDRFEVAIEAMDAVNKTKVASRKSYTKEPKKEETKEEKGSETPSIQATE